MYCGSLHIKYESESIIMMISVVYVWSMMVSFSFVFCCGQSINNSRELLQTVLKTYDRRLRPNVNQFQQTIVNVSFGILSIEDLDEVNSKFSVTGYLILRWTDEVIFWDPEDNHGINLLMFPATEVWYPVLVLGFAYGKAENPVDDWMNVRIAHNGRAFLAPRDVFKSTCSVDLTYYPFDVQKCSMVFFAWDYDKGEIKLQTPEQYVYAYNYVDHGEWEIIGNSSVADPTEIGVLFNFTLRRKSLFYVVNIILPIILMSLLNVLVFALPPEAGERVSYSITVLLAMVVFLTMVSDNLPKTSTPMPLLSFFLMVNLITSTIVCVSTILNLRLYFKGNSEPFPSWVYCILRITSCYRTRDLYQHRADIKNKVEHTQDGSCMVNDESTDVKTFREKGQLLTWADVSKSIDKVCVVTFLFVTLTNSVVFMLIVTIQ